MTAPASAPPLAVIPHIKDEIIVKVTLHDAGGPAKNKPSVWFRRGCFRNPSFKDITKWLLTSPGYTHKYAPYYKDQEGDTISIFSEEDWDGCVHAWRHSDVIRLAIAINVESKVGSA